MSVKNILNVFKNFPQVRAIAIGGSNASKQADYLSDIDVYIFVESDIPVKERENFIKQISSKYETGGEYFGSGDEFFADELNIQFDIMYWNTGWFESVVENVWEKYYPSNGYTTAFLYTLHNFEIIYDKNNWLLNLQNKIKGKYPKELQENVIKRNLMLMKDKPFASYYEQIEKAIKREDFVSVNHRISAFLASYFDIIFAKNKLLHPGEKRLINYAKTNCIILPENFEGNIKDLLIQPNPNTIEILDKMIINLKKIL